MNNKLWPIVNLSRKTAFEHLRNIWNGSEWASYERVDIRRWQVFTKLKEGMRNSEALQVPLTILKLQLQLPRLSCLLFVAAHEGFMMRKSLRNECRIKSQPVLFRIMDLNLKRSRLFALSGHFKAGSNHLSLECPAGDGLGSEPDWIKLSWIQNGTKQIALLECKTEIRL